MHRLRHRAHRRLGPPPGRWLPRNRPTGVRAMTGSAARHRYRIRFSKLGKIRFTSHRDVARMWERAVRRVGLPIAYSEGFSPRPKVHFGLALSTGHESLGEYLDIDLAPADGVVVDIPGLPELLTPALPDGIDVQAAALADRSADSLQAAVTSCSWRLDLDGGSPDDLTTAVEGL